MKKILIPLFGFLLAGNISIAQNTTVVSDLQNYVRGIASSKFSDSLSVTIAYDLDNSKVEFIYPAVYTPKYDDIKSLKLSLAFVDKESNAPGIYAETLDKDISSVLIYDDRIEIHYRNGNLSVFTALHKPAPAGKSTSSKPKSK